MVVFARFIIGNVLSWFGLILVRSWSRKDWRGAVVEDSQDDSDVLSSV